MDFPDNDDDDFEALLRTEEEEVLTVAQRERAERNRLKALSLKKSRLVPSSSSSSTSSSVVSKKKDVVDSGAGFFIDEDDEDGDQQSKTSLTETPAPIIPSDRPCCLDCSRSFSDSFLFRSYDYPVCDSCKEEDRDKHELITRTEAKRLFLLKDPDFDVREPILKFILRKNPHNPRWGEMKLYLRSQIEDRALLVWGSESALEEELEKKEGRKETLKKRKFEKRIKELRMKVRGSLFTKKYDVHEHKYGEETYDEEEDQYSKSCSECGHTQTYEKM